MATLRKSCGYKSRLPGIEDTNIWSKELIYIFRKYRNFISQSELHYFLYHPEHLLKQQQELWGYRALGGIKFLADVRSRHLKIKALDKFKINRIYAGTLYMVKNIIFRILVLRLISLRNS